MIFLLYPVKFCDTHYLFFFSNVNHSCNKFIFNIFLDLLTDNLFRSLFMFLKDFSLSFSFSGNDLKF